MMQLMVMAMMVMMLTGQIDAAYAYDQYDDGWMDDDDDEDATAAADNDDDDGYCD